MKPPERRWNTFKVFIVTVVAMSMTACSLNANIAELLGKNKDSAELSIDNSTQNILVNATNYQNKTIEGACPNEGQTLLIKIQETQVGNATCSDLRWSFTYDFSSIPDNENIKIEVSDETTTTTGQILKDTLLPVLQGLGDELIPATNLVSTWSCQDTQDQCQFRFTETESPVHVFLVESFGSTNSQAHTTEGVRYLYVQAIDKALNQSAAQRVQILVGVPQIFIGNLFKEVTTAGVEDLNVLAPASLSEMALFNNQNCTGVANWQARQSVVPAWSLDPSSEGGTAHVSVKFRTSSLEESSCYSDSILWPQYTQMDVCTAGSSSLDRGQIVDSGGTSSDYANSENCTLNLNLSGPTKFYFDVFNTESGYDYLEILDNGVQVFNLSGYDNPTPVTTTSNNVQVKFTSDSSVVEPGFEIRWQPLSANDYSNTAITLNGGAPIATSATVAVSLAAPGHLTQAYLTEDSSCSAGGSWASLASSNSWTFSDTTNGVKFLYVKFKDALDAETFCNEASVELDTPQVTVDGPANGAEISNSLTIYGFCTVPNKAIEITGSLSASTTCDNSQSWTHTFNTSAIANGTSINFVVDHKDGTQVLASTTANYLIRRTFAISSPAANATIGPNTTFGGTCNVNGATISISSPSSTTATCSGGSWSSSLAIAGADGAGITFTASLIDNSVTQETKSASYTLSTTPPTVVINGSPSGISTATSINITFTGANVSKAKYKIGNAIDCSDSTGYGAEVNAGAVQSINLGALGNGGVTLCAVGLSSVNGLWQDYSSATSATWTKDSAVSAIISSQNTSVIEGTTNNVITFSLTGTKTYDVRVYYNYFGNQVYMVDHNLLPGFVTIPAGTLSASVSYDTFDTGIAEGDRNLRVYITHTNQTAVNIGTLNQAYHLIKDDDAAYKTIQKLSVARYNTCAIYSDGKLFCWGDNYSGQLGVGHKNPVYTVVEPMPAETFLEVYVNDQYGCALTTGKKIKCWGYNYYGNLGNGNKVDQLTPVDVDASENYNQISIGGHGGCGVTDANKIKCWGRNSSGQNGDGTTNESLVPITIDSGTDYVYVSRSYITCGITTAQELKCWGDNYYQQIVVGGGTTVLTPTVVDAGTSYLKVEASSTICGITSANKLKCWGWNGTTYQVGNNSATNPITARTTIDSGTDYIDLGMGCAVTSANDLKCWGEVRGTYSASQTTIQPVPTLVNDGIKYSKIYTSAYGYCGISLDGQLVCMGDNANKWFFPKIDFDFVQVDPNTTFVHYGVGTATACGIKSDGLASCWGGYHTGAGPSISTPVIVDSGADYTGGKAVPSNNGSCVINGSGDLKCAGSNGMGAVGNASADNTVLYMSTVAPGVAFANAAREQFYCGLGVSTSGKLYVWGSSGGGADCKGPNPTMIDTATDYRPETLRVSSSFYCAITTSDQIKCFGYDDNFGNLGGTSKASPTLLDAGTTYQQVEISYAHICGLTTANTIKCWGKNGQGKVGNGSTTDISVPFTVDSANTYSALSVGEKAVCGVRTNGDLKCWGYWGDYTFNIINSSPTLVNGGVSYADIKVASNSSIALTTDGKVHYFPTNRFDQAPTVIQPSVTFTSIKAHGEGYTFCAMDNSNKVWCNKGNWDGNYISTPRYMPFRRQ